MIDATGLLLIPGGIDPHTHLAPNDNYHDDYESGSAAALAGGVTTISNQVPAQSGEALTLSLDRAAELVRAQAIADVFLHPIVLDPAAETPEGMQALVDYGQPSVKVRLHRGAYTTDPYGYMTGFANASDAGVVTMVHAEDGPINNTRAERLISEGRGSIHNLIERYCQVGESRPNIVGLDDAPSTISWGRIGFEALNLTIPFATIVNSLDAQFWVEGDTGTRGTGSVEMG